ncbi:MAG: prepilin peptidase [Planctomycetaceae bacterium]|jgi:leader peptidase (prepilin peptidase) / N-methyltransferase|nr:prepilin peptidase [Planctomycetaceae bacterium]
MNTTDNQPSENLISDDDSLKPADTPIESHFFRRHGRKIAGGLVLLIFIGIPLLLATIKFLEKLQIGHDLGVAFFLEQFSKYFLMTAGIFWFFFFGASFGSFLNVIAWRLPRGGTLLGSSYCESCNVKLKMRDNFPLFGWLWLRGKCRTCEVKISGRYLIVEVISAIAIGTLAFVEMIGAGVNLFQPTNSVMFSFQRFVISPEPRFIGYFLMHSCLIFILMTTGLVSLQQQRIPRNIFYFGFFISIITAICWPLAIPFTHTNQEIISINSMFASVLPMICGLGSGGILGILSTQLLMKKNFREIPEFTILMALTGSFLGWQATVVAGCLTGMILLIIRIFSKERSAIELLWLSVIITIFTFRFWMGWFENWLPGNSI